MADPVDPFKPADATVMRPRPGGGRRQGGDATLFPKPSSAGEPAWEASAFGALELPGHGLSPLVQAAAPVLMLAGQLRGVLSVGDVPALRRHASEEIRRFEERARAAGASQETIMAARYALCATVDEAALSTPWGAQSDWAQQNLLVALHREAWGGEKFFGLLDRISPEPERHIELMELQYLCLASGFEGRYKVADRGREQLEDIRHDLYRRIRSHRGEARPELSLRWRGLEDRRNPIVRYVPWWVVGAGALALVAVVFSVYYMRLGGWAAPVHAQLAQVGIGEFSRPRPAVPSRGPTLKQLLAPEERNGLLQVEEDGGRTLVTLSGNALFASGSASLGSTHEATLARVAAAVNQVPGRVLVVGHTDDQPIQSFRYRDNFELSRERAVSVARLLQRGLTDPARVEWSGVGSSQPRFTPPAEPENRARNRRVEIVHLAG